METIVKALLLTKRNITVQRAVVLAAATALLSGTAASAADVPWPVSSNVAASDITATTALINWTTSQPSTARVNFGTTPNYGSTSGTPALTTTQSVTLIGLKPFTTYNYQVISTNSSGLSSTSDNFVFTTPGPALAPPAISDVASWGINPNGATISWATDVNANTVVAYGTTPALGQLYEDATPGGASTVSHGPVLTGLTPGTTYYFVAESTGANGITGNSAMYNFTTSGTAPTDPGFTLSATAVTTVIGSAGTSTVTIAPVNGFNGSVTLAASGWPAGITAVFPTNPVSLSANMTINASASVTPGSYKLTLAASSGALSATATIVLTVTDRPGFTLSASQAAANVGNPTTYFAYGDSNTLGAGASTPANAYPNLMASDLKATLTNRPAYGTQACDTTQTVMGNDNPPETRAPFQTLMIGTNDAFFKGAGSYEAIYKACHTASLAWLAIPATQKTLAQQCTRSGSWIEDSNYLPGMALKSSVNGSQLSCTVNSYGGPIYLWYRATDFNGGVFTYSIDGAPAQLVNAFGSVSISTAAGGNIGVFLLRIPGASAGLHNVQISVASPTSPSNVVSILALGSLNPLSQSGAPALFVGGILREQNDSLYAATAAYDVDASADVALLSGDGLPVYFVPVRDYVNAATDMSDGLHINDSGHQHVRTAFESGGPFSAYATGVVQSVVTIAPINGFNSPVTLAPSGWPSGIAAAFGTNPAVGSTVVSLNIDSTVAPGRYILPVTGTSGTLSANTAIALTVHSLAGLPSFSLSATTATANAASTTTATVAVIPANGFNSPVTLAPSGWPAGITGAFATNPVLSSSIVNINVAPGVAPGTYLLPVNGTGGGLSVSTTIPLSVNAALKLAISSVAVSALTPTSATISWTTNGASNSQVAYGTTTSYGALSSIDNTLVTSHSVTLTGLTPGTTYNFSVISANGTGVAASSSNATFQTAAVPGPIISTVATWPVTDTTATILWVTDQNATSQVNYGTTAAYGNLSPMDTTLSNYHAVKLTGLTPGTTYNFSIVSVNSSNVSSSSPNYTFTTTATGFFGSTNPGRPSRK